MSFLAEARFAFCDRFEYTDTSLLEGVSNTSKIKSIGPCVYEMEAKMRANFVGFEWHQI